MNRRAFGLAALSLLPLPAGAAEQGAAAATPSGRPHPQTNDPGRGAAGAAPAGGGMVEWEGYAFDAGPPCTAYVVERTDTLAGGTVGLLFLLPGFSPIGPVTHPAAGAFAGAAVGDACQLGVEGGVEGERCGEGGAAAAGGGWAGAGGGRARG
ncbi:MAG: hypothetical protein ACKOWF_01975, partial [Chloroflexota bacterium]